MLLLCRLRNREGPGSKETPFLPEGSLPGPVLQRASLWPLHGARSLGGLWDVPTWSLNPSILDHALNTQGFRISCPDGPELISRACESLPGGHLSEGRQGCWCEHSQAQGMPKGGCLWGVGYGVEFGSDRMLMCEVLGSMSQRRGGSAQQASGQFSLHQTRFSHGTPRNPNVLSMNLVFQAVIKAQLS